MGILFRSLHLLLVEASKVEEFRIMRELDRDSGNTNSCNIRSINNQNISYQRVENPAEMQAQLSRQSWDVVLCSFQLPDFSAIEALNLLQSRGLDLPFIVLFDDFEEEGAIEVMKAGAHDCLFRGRLKRLSSVMLRELHAAEIRLQKRQTEAALLKLTLEEMADGQLAEKSTYELLVLLNHELRTPLASIQASIELLRTGHLGSLSERGQYLLDIAARNTDRLVQLTDRMLELESFALPSPYSSNLMESVRDR